MGRHKKKNTFQYYLSDRARYFRASLKEKLCRQLLELGHDMGFWYFSEEFPAAECCWCKKCGLEATIGLPLISPIGEALVRRCGE